MAYFAKLDENNNVTQVIVVDVNEVFDEKSGIDFCQKLTGHVKWKMVPDSNIRPGNGFTYDEKLGVFISPKPYSSWVLNEVNEWEAPINKPDEKQEYVWDEKNITWVADVDLI